MTTSPTGNSMSISFSWFKHHALERTSGTPANIWPMSRMLRKLVVAAVAGVAARGQASAPPINTDRASANRFERGRPGGKSSTGKWHFGDGKPSKTELRLTAPDHFVPIGAGSGSGFGDLSIGVKQQLGPVDGFDVSLVLSLRLPSGARAFSSHGYDPSVQLPWSRSVSANWTVAGMLSVYFPTQGDRRDVTGETTLLIGRQLTKHSMRLLSMRRLS
jgi:hypothetical protein